MHDHECTCHPGYYHDTLIPHIGVITDIRPVVINGNSIYYIALDGKATYYSISAAADETVVILNVGDTVKISYKTAEGNIITAKSVER